MGSSEEMCVRHCSPQISDEADFWKDGQVSQYTEYLLEKLDTLSSLLQFLFIMLGCSFSSSFHTDT